MNNLFPKIIASGYYLFTGRQTTTSSADISNTFVGLAFKLGIAKIFVMISVILIGKFLGTASYGNFALVLAIGNFWCLPFFTSWGLSYVKFASESKIEHSSGSLLSATFSIATLIIGLVLPFLLVFRNPLSAMVNVSPSIWVWGCIFGVLMGGYYFSKNIFQAGQKWSYYVIGEYFFAGTLSIGILTLFLAQPGRKFISALVVFGIAHLVVMLFAFPMEYRSMRFPLLKDIKRIGIYGYGLLISFGLSLVAMQMDKLLLNYYTDSSVVGRYQAYYVSTFGLLSSFIVILNNYLLPLYGKHSKETIKRMLIRFLFIVSVPIWFLCMFFGRFAFILFGKSFAFKWVELCWASTFSVSNFWIQVIVFFSMTLGQKALLFNAAAYVVFITVQLISIPVLAKISGVSGTFQGMTAASLSGFGVIIAAVFFLMRKK
jgi:O-antigen/teichoic acid export membrane protein